MVNIGFRVNANFKTGPSHLQRCLTLASGLMETEPSCKIFFLMPSSEYTDKISSLGFTHIDLGPLSTTYENFEATKEAIKQNNLEILIVDSYDTDEYLLKSLKKEIFLVVVDDFIHLKTYPSHILINPNTYAHTLTYQHDDNTLLLLGTEFVQINQEFDQYEDFERQTPPEVKHIIVSFGCSDKGATLLAVIALKSLSNHFSATIIVDKAFKDSEALAKEIGLDSRFTVLQDVTDISKKMAMCDLAISSPDINMYELAFFKIPTIIIFQSNKQELIADYAGKNELAVSVGDIKNLTPTRLSNTIAGLISNKQERDRISARLDGLVDNLGRFRVAEEILKLYKEKTGAV